MLAHEFQIGQLDELQRYVERLRQDRRKIVFTNGCFDLLHAGHVSLLRTAAIKYGAVIVGINSDKGAEELKGPGRPIEPLHERILKLRELRSVNAVIPFETDPFEIIVAIEPDFLIKGAEYDEADIIGAEIVKARGGKVVRFPTINGISTTNIIKRIQQHKEYA